MSTCVIVGRPNGGKTSFYRGFVRFLGYPLPNGDSCQLSLRWRRMVKPCELVDTVSLVHGIHPDPAVRAGMARTLGLMESAYLIIHVISAPVAEKGLQEATGAIDMLISKYARKKKRYLVLANKFDLPGAKAGLRCLQTALSGQLVIPVSATLRTGFSQVHQQLFDLL